MAKILLVEDDNNLREIYEARLMAEGYQITTARDGEEALVVAKKDRPDLIISDVMMPRISGFEMLDILRNTDGLKDVKVIMLTALGQAEDKTRADSLGADRYLVKSQVTLEDIVKAATDLLAGAPSASATTPSTAAAAAEMTAAPTAVQTPVAVAPAPTVPAATPTPEPATPAAPVLAAPMSAPAEPAQTSDQMVANAVKDFVSSTEQPAPAPAASAPAPAMFAATPAPEPVSPTVPTPAAATMPPPATVPPVAPPLPGASAAITAVPTEPSTPATPPVTTPEPTATPPATPPAPEDDGVTISGKKIIAPISTPAAAEPPDLNALLAKEGITDMGAPDAAAAPTNATLPHQPGNVISPTPTDAAGHPIDPSSISL